jgi:hypothetical protein
MQPLRGLASLAEYPPLPDLLDGIERAAGLVARSAGSMEAPGVLLATAARALTNATRDITTSGKANPDATAVRDFAAALRTALGFDQPDIPIEELYTAEGPSIVERGARAQGPRLGNVELTALGEHLKQVGIGIASAASGAQRELRVLALVDPLRALEDGAADDLQGPVRAFARVCRDAIVADVVGRSWEPLGHAVQEAGVAVAAGRPDALERIAAQIGRLGTPPAGAAPEPAPAQVVPPPQRAPVAAAPPQRAPAAPRPAAPTVIRAPVQRPPAPTRPAAPPPAPEPEIETPDLAGSITRYQRLMAEVGLGEPSLDEFLAALSGARTTGAWVSPASTPAAAAPARAPAPAPPSARPAPAPAARPAPAPAAPATRAAPAAAVDEPVPITALCYSGKTALDRALSLRDRVAELVASGAPAGDVQELLEEVFDLVRLGASGPA